MLTLDTSAVYACMRLDDPHHRWAVRARDTERGSLYITSGILAEIAYLVEATMPAGTLDRLLEDLAGGRYLTHDVRADFERIRQLTRRYSDLPLGFSDASVVACAERHGGRILTTDRRHFRPVARGQPNISLVEEQ